MWSINAVDVRAGHMGGVAETARRARSSVGILYVRACLWYVELVES